jgi:cell volume regulation protein A
VLATIPLAEGVPQADRIFDVVFVLVLLFTLLQGPSLPWLARRLKVLDENAGHEVDIDIAPLESLGADMIQVHVPSESRLAGVEIGELRLPAADSLLVVAPSPLREQTVHRLRAVSRAGRLAGWFGERGREQL